MPDPMRPVSISAGQHRPELLDHRRADQPADDRARAELIERQAALQRQHRAGEEARSAARRSAIRRRSRRTARRCRGSRTAAMTTPLIAAAQQAHVFLHLEERRSSASRLMSVSTRVSAPPARPRQPELRDCASVLNVVAERAPPSRSRGWPRPPSSRAASRRCARRARPACGTARRLAVAAPGVSSRARRRSTCTSSIALTIDCGVMPCSSLYASCIARRRSVSLDGAAASSRSPCRRT